MKDGPMSVSRLQALALCFLLLLMARDMGIYANEDDDDDNETHSDSDEQDSKALREDSHSQEKKAIENTSPDIGENLPKTKESAEAQENVDTVSTVNTPSTLAVKNSTTQIALGVDKGALNIRKPRLHFIEKFSGENLVPVSNESLRRINFPQTIIVVPNPPRLSHKRLQVRTGRKNDSKKAKVKVQYKRGHGQAKARSAPDPPKPPLTRCIVCDSQRNPKNCTEKSRNDTLMQFAKNCSEDHPWCYVSYGNVSTIAWLDGRLRRVNITKIDRGCTRLHNDELCTRIKQKDGYTDFTVCLCNNSLCNMRFNKTGKMFLFPNGAIHLTSDRSLAIAFSVFISVSNVFYSWSCRLY